MPDRRSITLRKMNELLTKLNTAQFLVENVYDSIVHCFGHDSEAAQELECLIDAFASSTASVYSEFPRF